MLNFLIQSIHFIYMLIKDVFAKYRYPENKMEDVTVTYVHWGAENDRKRISGDEIEEVARAYFEYKEGGKLRHIPFHRIL